MPRRNDRQMYYANDLVASAVKFDSNMEEADIKNEIMERFPQFKFPH